MWNFFESFFIEIVITIIFSTTLFAFYVKKFRNRINERALNLTKIYKEGKDIKKMKRAMQSASKIYSLAFVPYSLIVDNEELLVKKLNEGCCIRFLFCNSDSTMIKEASEMENL